MYSYVHNMFLKERSRITHLNVGSDRKKHLESVSAMRIDQRDRLGRTGWADRNVRPEWSANVVASLRILAPQRRTQPFSPSTSLCDKRARHRLVRARPTQAQTPTVAAPHAQRCKQIRLPPTVPWPSHESPHVADDPGPDRPWAEKTASLPLVQPRLRHTKRKMQPESFS